MSRTSMELRLRVRDVSSVRTVATEVMTAPPREAADSDSGVAAANLMGTTAITPDIRITSVQDGTQNTNRSTVANEGQTVGRVEVKQPSAQVDSLRDIEGLTNSYSIIKSARGEAVNVLDMSGFKGAQGRGFKNGDSGKHEKASASVRYLCVSDLNLHVVGENNLMLKRIFDIVASTGQPNYRGARMPLPSALNIDRWRCELRGYSDYKMQYLEYGWPIGIDRQAVLRSHFANHASALAHPRMWAIT